MRLAERIDKKNRKIHTLVARRFSGWRQDSSLRIFIEFSSNIAGKVTRARSRRVKIRRWKEKRCVILQPDEFEGVEENRRQASVTMRFHPWDGYTRKFELSTV